VLTKDTAAQVLREVPLLAGLSKRDLARVLELGELMDFPAGELIVKPGDLASDFFIQLQGRARVSAVNSTRTVGPGDYFGEMAVLDWEPRSASIVAETDVTALRIGRGDFLDLLDAHGSIGRKILVELSMRVRSAESRGET
jgi:CRP-like cAMP-binding protein